MNRLGNAKVEQVIPIIMKSLGPVAIEICKLADKYVLTPIVNGNAIPTLICSDTTQRNKVSLLEYFTLANAEETSDNDEDEDMDDVGSGADPKEDDSPDTEMQEGESDEEESDDESDDESDEESEG